MKRIDIEKPVAPEAKAEATQSAWSDAWNQQLSRSAEIYGRVFAALSGDFRSLVQKRIDADLETARCLGACRTMTDALDLQQKWLREAIEHYTQHAQRMAELCQAAMSEPSETVKPAESAGPKTATERKSAGEHTEAGDRRAA